MLSTSMLLLIQAINSITRRTNLFCRFWETESGQVFPKLQVLFNMRKWMSAITKQISAAFLPGFVLVWFGLLVCWVFGGVFFVPGGGKKLIKAVGFLHEVSQEGKFVNKELEDRSSWIVKLAPITNFSVTVGQFHDCWSIIWCDTPGVSVCFKQIMGKNSITVKLAFHLWKTCHLFSVCSHY